MRHGHMIIRIYKWGYWVFGCLKWIFWSIKIELLFQGMSLLGHYVYVLKCKNLVCCAFKGRG